MRSIQLRFLMIALIATFASRIQAQQHQARNWYCVRQPFVETTDGDVVALQCVAALPQGQKLDAEDEDLLTKLEVDRWNVRTFTSASQQERSGAMTKGVENPKHWDLDTGKGKELIDGLRMGFGQNVGQLCQKHPNIVLAPLFPDLISGTTTLYGCKNIIAAPEK
jgi:hypothetical protein